MSSAIASRPSITLIPVEREDCIAIAHTTFEEWDEWEDGNTRSEWVDGEMRVYMGVTLPHDQVNGFLRSLLDFYGEMTRTGRANSAPYGLRAAPGGSGREPDVMFIKRGSPARREERHVEGPADLVVEIVSKDSVTRDNRDKFREYEAAGIPEYWIIDPRPRRRTARFYVLEEGRYSEVFPDAGGIYRSTVLPGFWLRLSWLWEEEPRPLAAWNEIAATLATHG